MRKLLILSVLGLLTVSATGCATRMSCGDTWRPGYYLFGWGRNSRQSTAVECCDPCATSAPAMMTSAPCCQ